MIKQGARHTVSESLADTSKCGWHQVRSPSESTSTGVPRRSRVPSALPGWDICQHTPGMNASYSGMTASSARPPGWGWKA
ncbi:hypothetical protein Pmani_007287 [Petrolisthes manimaculis]|uniref:Uncharacterized protein n=1 Tax=Petrolisthes manimaculis TaxID=1843537 RepID=A0AAE1UIV0_9EUCA|nr:hypothetical protein Pmani_007287 [Petrolisthes manimaculis]